mmetsp:Transcript_64443/g.119879  ORF Transcript_64443/g.119879 Transcript_64443/m.119879 type:complete len:438 (-) Transcript_64443:22-1335(-)
MSKRKIGLLDENDDDAFEGAAPKTKKAEGNSRQASWGELEPGVLVENWDEWQGVVRDVDVESKKIWCADAETGETADVTFGLEDLWIMKKQPLPPKTLMQNGFGSLVGCMIIGNQAQMIAMLQHYGVPNTARRRHPQQLFPVECTALSANRSQLLSIATEGVDDTVLQRAKRLRSDIDPTLRVSFLESAVRQMGPDLRRLKDWYLLASIAVPHSRLDMDSHHGWERHWRQHVYCQVDVGPTICGACEEEDEDLCFAAQRLFTSSLGVVVHEMFWANEVQFALREHLGVNVPLKIKGPYGAKIFVVMMPDTAVAIGVRKGLLLFEEVLEEKEPEPPAVAPAVAAQRTAEPPVGGKSIAQWKKEQAQFANLPQLPPGWIRIRSRGSGEIYFYNVDTKETSRDMPEFPLPEGWTREVSKSTGQTYYFHAGRRESTYKRPT